MGEDSVDEQIEQVLDNLDAVLSASGSSLGQLVRLNVYAIAPTTVDRVREQLTASGWSLPFGPTITAVLTPMPHRDALVAVDAVAVAADQKAKRWPSSDAKPWPATRTAPTRPCCLGAVWRICPACRPKADSPCRPSTSRCPSSGKRSTNSISRQRRWCN